MKIVGLGNALVDVLLKLENDSVLSEIGVKKGAMDLIDKEQMIMLRKKQEMLERSEVPGGSVCNTIRAMARLGAKTGFIGKIGSDSVGSFYENSIVKAGVAPYFVKVEGISGSSTVLISPDGERTMCTFLGPAATLSADEINKKILESYQLIYIEGYLIVNELLFRATLRNAKELGLKVALDLSNFNIVNGFKDMLKEVIPQYVDILFSNESEAEAFTGLKAIEAVKEISKMVDISIVTVGKEGALVGCSGNVISVPAEGGKPVDTTGAGDHFAAGFLYGQSIGATLKQSAQIGSVLSGYAIDVIGAQIPEDKWEQIKLKVNKILA